MEYILALFLFLMNKVTAPGLVDGMIILAGVLFVCFFLRDKNDGKYLGMGVAFSVVVTVALSLIPVSNALSGSVLFGVKLLEVVLLMIYLSRDRYRFSFGHFACAMVFLQGIGTVIALLKRGTDLWKVVDYGWMHTEKLKLFYEEPTYLALVSGMLLLYFIAEMMRKDFSIALSLGALVCLADLYYSFSIGAVVATGVALLLLVVMNRVHGNHEIHPSKKRRYRTLFVILVAATLLITLLSPIYRNRILTAFQGTDESYYFSIAYPLSVVKDAFLATKGRGLGIGQSDAYRNAYLDFVAECGIFAVLIILTFNLWLAVNCVKEKVDFSLVLLVFVVLHQFTGGSFLNPILWFCYGIILQGCLRKQIQEAKKSVQENTGKQSPKTTVAIIGAKGFGNYGGFETFVDHLTEIHEHNEKLEYLIACKKTGVGATLPEDLRGATVTGTREFSYHGAKCFQIPVPQIGSAQAIVYDVLSARTMIRYFKKNQVEKPVLYILASRMGPFMRHIVARVHEAGGVVYLNPDGHEFLRSVWSPTVRSYWKLSERLMVKYADKVICDSKNIETYIGATYGEFEPDTTYIAYGTDLNKSNADVSTVTSFGVQPGKYYLVVGRFVPENNYETMIREFMASKVKKDLVLVTNYENNPYFYEQLKKKLDFEKDERIKFIGTIYEEEVLKKLREEAYGYIHGHEVGGTNPSLIEALGSTKLNLLYDIGFNRECGEHAALYFRKEEGNLASLLERCESMTEEEIATLETRAKERVKEAYTWEWIGKEYERVFC